MLQFHHLQHFPVTWKAWCGWDSVVVLGYFGLISTLDAAEDSWILIKTPHPSTPCPVVCLPLKIPQLQDVLPAPCTAPWQFWFSCAIVWAHHQPLWPSGWVCNVAEDTWLINCSNIANTTLPRLVSRASSTRNPTCITETKHLLPVLFNMKVMQTPRAK